MVVNVKRKFAITVLSSRTYLLNHKLSKTHLRTVRVCCVKVGITRFQTLKYFNLVLRYITQVQCSTTDTHLRYLLLVTSILFAILLVFSLTNLSN